MWGKISLMDEPALIHDAQHGDLNAFNSLVLTYQDIVFNTALRILGDEDLAADASQDAFISAFRALNSYRGGSFRAWLLRTTTNACYDELRRKKRRPTTPLEPETGDGEDIETPRWLTDPNPTPEVQLDQIELEHAIQHCLENLPTDFLLSEFLEPTLIQPTFLYDYPRDISPLAKSKPGDPLTVERFEGYVAGFELCNAFTELNDPLDQEQRFLEMGRTYRADEEERNPLDEDYLRAMRYGMPPCGGFGMGVDRLAMLLTDQHSIREVLLFPHMRNTEE